MLGYYTKTCQQNPIHHIMRHFTDRQACFNKHRIQQNSKEHPILWSSRSQATMARRMEDMC